MVAQMGGRPVYVLEEGTRQIRGRDARRMNILAAKVIAEAVKSTLGPMGMDKMLVDTTGEVVITNDGATILKEVEVKHPAAKMIVEVAKIQEREVGDGTKTVVVLAGELLKRAEELLDNGIHATIIAKGYRIAGGEAKKILDEMGRRIKVTDEDSLRKVALTALSSKASGIIAKEHIANLAAKAVKMIAEEREGKFRVDKGGIKIQKQVGKATTDSEIVKGIVIDKERARANMPPVIHNAKIALLNSELKVKKTETDAKIGITTPEQLRSFLDKEEEALKEKVEDILKAGANCVFCQKDIDDAIQYLLAKEKVMAVESISEKDLKLIARATGGNIVTTTADITSKDLGRASKVEEKKVGGKGFIFIEGCYKPKAVSLFIRGGTEHITDEIERSLDDALSVVRNALEDRKILPGAGAPEAEVARRIRLYSNKISGREQLAIIEFANAMEAIPRILAENAGLDSIDVLIKLRAEHDKGRRNSGLDIFTGKPKDMLRIGVFDSLKVKQHAIKAATEVANMVLRIDDVIAAKGALEEEEEEKAPPRMPMY